MAYKTKYLILIFIILLCGCNSDNNPEYTEFNNLDYYHYDEIPKITCRQKAILRANWAEDFGYKAIIVYGKLNNIHHVETKIIDFDNDIYWVHGSLYVPELIESIDGFKAIKEYTLEGFIVQCRIWAIQNNFYRKTE